MQRVNAHIFGFADEPQLFKSKLLTMCIHKHGIFHFFAHRTLLIQEGIRRCRMRRVQLSGVLHSASVYC
jgi:hypothetical protein